MNPVLFVFSGLPGSGKSTLAKAIVVRTKSIYLRVDTIEQGIRDLCNYNVQGEGYRLSYRIAKENLIIGNSVVSDSCNPWELTRNEWKNLAIESNVKYINIEVMCSDKIEHKRRVETRKCEIEGLKLPTWEEIENKLAALPSFNPAARRIQRLLIGHATETELDSHGRILLAPLLREYAGLNRQIMLVGQGKKFEIWDEEHWQKSRAQWLEEESGAGSNLPDEVKMLSL